MAKMFFYGTLRQGGWNHERFFGRHNPNVKLLGTTTLRDYGVTVDLRNGLPYLAAATDAVTVGEVWDISQASFDTIDNMERQAGYKRKHVTVEVAGVPTTVTVYALDTAVTGSNFKFLTDGDYIKWWQTRQKGK